MKILELPTHVQRTPLAVRDLYASVAFYHRLGFTGPPPPVGSDPDDLPIIVSGTTPAPVLQHEAASRQQHPHLADTPLGGTVVLHLPVEDFDATATLIRAHSEVVEDLNNDGFFRMLTFRDPDGYHLAISQVDVRSTGD